MILKSDRNHSTPSWPPSTSLQVARGDRAAMAELRGVAADETMPELAEAAAKAIAAIERRYEMLSMAQNVYYGLSLGSVLLLAAIGLAITFGVMGVINMAHGEMVMIGAYTTFVVQEIIRQNAPWLFDSSLLIAIPLSLPDRRRVSASCDRARHHPLSLRPPARNPARHLGRQPDPAAGGALDLRPDQPAGRQPLLDGGRRRRRRPHLHL